MSKRIYLAAPWDSRTLMPEMAAVFEQAGYTITHKWWEFEGEEEETTLEFRQKCALQDIQGVLTAAAVVVLNSKKSEGKAVEQGLALAFNIPIVIIGDAEQFSNIFQTLPAFHWVDGMGSALDALREVIGE